MLSCTCLIISRDSTANFTEPWFLLVIAMSDTNESSKHSLCFSMCPCFESLLIPLRIWSYKIIGIKRFFCTNSSWRNPLATYIFESTLPCQIGCFLSGFANHPGASAYYWFLAITVVFQFLSSLPFGLGPAAENSNQGHKCLIKQRPNIESLNPPPPPPPRSLWALPVHPFILPIIYSDLLPQSRNWSNSIYTKLKSEP